MLVISKGHDKLKLKKVVITGMGAITPIGLNVEEFWRGLAEGKKQDSVLNAAIGTLQPALDAAILAKE